MKKIISLSLVVLATLVMPILAFGQSEERGSVQGNIYRDTNGDGLCQDGAPLAGATITFDLSGLNTKISTRSAADGSYNVGARQGDWTISASTRSGRWVTVSTNPIQRNVSTDSGLNQEGVNFCMQRVAVVGTPQSATGTANSVVQPTVVVNTTTKTLPEQSEELLTQPPESVQPDAGQLEEIASETIEERSVPVDEWLGFVNAFRTMAGVPPVQEDSGLTFGAQSHARYMVVHDRPIAHAEDPAFALYSPEGHIAGANGLIFATSQLQADHTWATNFFASGPFHLIPMIDPNLETVGFGAYNEDVGNFKMAGVLDVRSGLNQPSDPDLFPVKFPADGAETWVLRHSLYEWPDPTHHCGFTRPSGPPIVLMLGSGEGTPRVSSYKVTSGSGQQLNVCMFNETNFRGSDSAQQSTGRIIMDLRDAVVLIPQSQLAADSTYNVEIQVNGETHAWSFTTRKRP